MKTILYSLLPSLHDESGHVAIYNHSVSQAARTNGWKHISLIPKNCQIQAPPKTWIRALHFNTQIMGTFSVVERLLRPFFGNLLFFFYFLRKLRTKKAVLFLEYYTLPVLAALAVALFCIRPKVQFWHMIRFAPGQLKTGGKIHRLLQKLFDWGIGKNGTVLLSDSEPIAKELSLFLQKPVRVIPIPHTQGVFRKQTLSASPILCWWPGPPRSEKGLTMIVEFSRRLSQSSQPIQLLVADALQTDPTFQHKKVQFLPSILSREEYCTWLSRVHFVLLPYDKQIYGNRTSGIFVEAILSQAIPLVQADTWMSHECLRYDLSDYIVDWSCFEHRMSDLLGDQILHKRLEIMRQSYAEYHCESTFAKTLQHLEIR
ncbi:MAG: hypothetical protein HY069_04385 [Chlamydiia bacterium]|nr:hypothetical protein [Chlamydiia bacterium]